MLTTIHPSTTTPTHASVPCMVLEGRMAHSVRTRRLVRSPALL